MLPDNEDYVLVNFLEQNEPKSGLSQKSQVPSQVFFNLDLHIMTLTKNGKYNLKKINDDDGGDNNRQVCNELK